MSNRNDMTIDRFADILSAYGGNAVHWPVEDRMPAEQLLYQSGAARDMLESESALDRFLDMAPSPAPASSALHAQILDIAFGRPAASGEGVWDRFKDMWANSGALRPAGAALAASLMLGVVFGGMVGPASATADDPVDIMELALLDLTFTGY